MYIPQMKPYEGSEKYIFVSYSHKDAEDVLPILDSLNRKGYRVWYDEGITPGSEWPQYIADHLAACEVCIAFITPDYVESGNCNNELNFAIGMNKKFLGVLLRKTDIPMGMKLQLASKRYLNRSNYSSEERFLQDVCSAEGMNACFTPIEEPQPQPEEPKPVAEEKPAEEPVCPAANAEVLVKRGAIALDDKAWEKAAGYFEQAQNLDPHCAEAYLGELMVREKVTDLEELFRVYTQKYAQVQPERIEACPENTARIDEAVEKYKIDGYLNEEAIREEYRFDRGCDIQLPCRKKQRDLQLQELKKNRYLNWALQYAEGSFKTELEEKLQKLNALLNSRVADAEKADQENVAKVQAAYRAAMNAADEKIKAQSKAAEDTREKDYLRAADIFQKADNLTAFETAEKYLNKLNGYKDSAVLAEKCHGEAQRLRAEAENKRAEQKTLVERKAAEEKRQKKAAAKKRTTIIIATLTVCIAIALLVTQVIIPANNYKAALALKDVGNYAAAISAFEALDGYKDSADKLRECCKELYGDELYTLSVGSEYVFGTYEQDNDTSNGAEDIEWLVLDKTDSGILLISKYALDCLPYNTESTSVSWRTCSLRTWLNNDFYNTAFNTDEQALIATTKVTADNNPHYNSSAGFNTRDKVFLLSLNEAEKYFTSDSVRGCEPTIYASANGAYPHKSTGNCEWWLRTPGYSGIFLGRSFAVYVGETGLVQYGGSNVADAYIGIRPALWINY